MQELTNISDNCEGTFTMENQNFQQSVDPLFENCRKKNDSSLVQL